MYNYVTRNKHNDVKRLFQIGKGDQTRMKVKIKRTSDATYVHETNAN